MNGTPPCPCNALVHPEVISNPSGRDSIEYRIGEFAGFREALLLALPDETELANWRPSADDLAVQIVEWWAYLADILTFYNERIANEDYLRTIERPENLKHLIRILGYRPRPGIGACGVVAALMNSAKPFLLKQGFAVQSKPGPGKQPQIFELDADTQVQAPDAVDADPPPDVSLPNGDGSILVKGSVSSIKAGDSLLILKRGWTGTDFGYALVTVKTIQQEKDPHGRTNTRVRFNDRVDLPGAKVSDYTLLKSDSFAHVWSYPTDTVIGESDVHLESVLRQTKIGDPILFEVAPSSKFGGGVTKLDSMPPSVAIRSNASAEFVNAPSSSPAGHAESFFSAQDDLLSAVEAVGVFRAPDSPQLVSVTNYEEVIWYANASPSTPDVSPDPKVTPPVPIPHSEIQFQPALAGDWDGNRSSVRIRYAWREVGQLIASPAATFTGTPPEVHATPAKGFPTGNGQRTLIEAANGNGVSANGSVTSDLSVMKLSNLPDRSVMAYMTTPLRVLFNLLSVSRGKTVANEILGAGDATVAGQEFVLAKSPLTYLLSGDSSSGASYKSTLRVWVNGIEWKEVPNFYGQPADAQIFATREDENSKTHIQFGDGINGARLPSGIDNVVAVYRYGSGKESPEAGSLNVIVQPQPNLRAIRNPVPVGGGSDPDSPDHIRKYAPQSVLVFGRAISADDYETIAAQAPGVARARAYWTWDAEEQRALVKLYVGDDAHASDAANVALMGADDPNRPVSVRQASRIPVSLTLQLVIDSPFAPDNVVAAATSGLLDPEAGLFGIDGIGIGQSVYESEIYRACLSAPGVQAVRGLRVEIDRGSGLQRESGYRFDPCEGGFFELTSERLQITYEVSANAG